MRYVYPVVGLEYRQRGRHLRGEFPYGRTATISDRGRLRKERIGPRAFRYAVDDDAHEIDLLRGHDFDAPLASKSEGSLQLTDTPHVLAFDAELPPERSWPTWMQDTVLAVRSGLIRGVSPGFRVPPASAVRNAVEEIPEPGNPAVFIRQINEAVLYELSLVTRPAYPDTAVAVESRHDWRGNLPDLSAAGRPDSSERFYRWL